MSTWLPTEADLNRYQLYALIEALENDLRDLIDQYCATPSGLSLGSYHAKATAGRERDPDADATGASLTHYLDLGDEVDLLNEQREVRSENFIRLDLSRKAR